MLGCRKFIENPKWKENQKDRMVAITMTLLCFVITVIHGAFTSVYMMFVLPTLLTTLYERKRLTVTIAVLGMVLCVFSAFMPSWDPDKIITAYYFSDILICQADSLDMANGGTEMSESITVAPAAPLASASGVSAPPPADQPPA